MQFTTEVISNAVLCCFKQLLLSLGISTTQQNLGFQNVCFMGRTHAMLMTNISFHSQAFVLVSSPENQEGETNFVSPRSILHMDTPADQCKIAYFHPVHSLVNIIRSVDLAHNQIGCIHWLLNQKESTRTGGFQLVFFLYFIKSSESYSQQNFIRCPTTEWIFRQ